VYFDISDNNLETVPSSIVGCEKLETLKMKGNKLSAATFPFSLRKLTSLLHLEIDGDLEEKFQHDGSVAISEATKQVMEEFITSNIIEEETISSQSPQDAAEAYLRTLGPDTTQINLSGLKLSHVPDALRELKLVTSLDLSHNRLTTLPGWLHELPLSELNLSWNSFRELPLVLGGLKNLVRLDLLRNGLDTIPDFIGNLTELTHLTVFRNELTSVSPQISCCSNLHHLTLNMNRLSLKEGFPLGVRHMNLQVLYLDDDLNTALLHHNGSLSAATKQILEEIAAEDV